MDIGTIHGIYTLIFMLAFIGLAVFVFLPRRKKHYDDAASLPFNSEEKQDEGKDKAGQGGSRRPDQGE
ncbi:MAG: cbb3-type cytochrome oxidase subunit 3 [Pseudomonadota bacterium]